MEMERTPVLEVGGFCYLALSHKWVLTRHTLCSIRPLPYVGAMGKDHNLSLTTQGLDYQPAESKDHRPSNSL